MVDVINSREQEKEIDNVITRKQAKRIRAQMAVCCFRRKQLPVLFSHSESGSVELLSWEMCSRQSSRLLHGEKH